MKNTRTSKLQESDAMFCEFLPNLEHEKLYNEVVWMLHRKKNIKRKNGEIKTHVALDLLKEVKI